MKTNVREADAAAVGTHGRGGVTRHAVPVDTHTPHGGFASTARP